MGYFHDRAIPRHQGALKPLFNQVVIRPLRPLPSEDSAALIAVPDSARKQPDRGVVVAVGEGHKYRTRYPGEPSCAVKHSEPLPVTVGDSVLYLPSGGEDHEFNGELLHMTPIEHVLAVLES